MAELEGVRDREANNFTSALRETFKTIVFPMTRALRRVDDFRMEFDRNDYSGEQQIIDTLAKRGKFIPSRSVRRRVRKHPAGRRGHSVRRRRRAAVSLRRNAAVRPGWFWLPRGGLRELIRARRAARLLARKGRARRQEMGAAHARHRAAGRFRAGPDRSPAGSRSTSRPRTPTPSMCPRAARPIRRRRQSSTAGFTRRRRRRRGSSPSTPRASQRPGDVCEWRAPIRVKPDVRRVSGGYGLACGHSRVRR